MCYNDNGDSMKSFNQKGFSLVEILAAVALLGILTGVAIQGYTRYIDYTRKKAYQYMANSAETAMNNYILDHPNATEVTLQELYEGNYIDRPADPRSSGDICRGKVIITNVEESDDMLALNEYKVVLCCLNYNCTYTNKGKTRHVDSTCQMN